MRKHINLNTSDYKEIDIDDVNKFLDWHEDEVIDGKLSMFGSQGIDLTDPKYNDENGRNYYREWSDRKMKKAKKYKVQEVVDKEAIKRKAKQFDEVVDNIIGKRKIIEFAQQHNSEGK